VTLLPSEILLEIRETLNGLKPNNYSDSSLVRTSLKNVCFESTILEAAFLIIG